MKPHTLESAAVQQCPDCRRLYTGAHTTCPAAQGPPPCQSPECTETAHVRTGYTYCTDHDYCD